MADSVFPISDYVATKEFLRDWMKDGGVGDYIQSGFVMSDGGGLNVSVSAGVALAQGARLSTTAAIVGALTASTTNHVFLTLDEAAASPGDVILTINTTGTAPGTPYLKLGTVTTNGSSVTGITTILYLVSRGFPSPFSGGVNATAFSSGSTLYAAPHTGSGGEGAGENTSSTENQVTWVAPRDGTVRNLRFIKASHGHGFNGTYIDIIFRKNASNQSLKVRVTTEADGTIISDLTTTFSVVAGDKVTFKIETDNSGGGGSNSSVAGNWSFLLV